MLARLRKLGNRWTSLSKYRRGMLLTKALMSILMFTAGIVLYSVDTTIGVPRVMVDSPPFFLSPLAEGVILFKAFCVFTSVCGIVLVFIPRPSAWQFFFLTSPIFTYYAYNVLGVLRGIIINPQGVLFNGILYLLLCVVYWGFTDD